MPSNPDYYPIQLPSVGKSKCELWSTLNQTQLEILLTCLEEELSTSPYSRFSTLISKELNLDPHNSTRDRLLVDKYYYLIKFGLDNEFSRQQVSALVSIFTRLHRSATNTPFGNLEQSIEHLTMLMLAYTVHRPPHSIQLFSPQQAQIVYEYFMSSYFKSYRAVKYAFTPSVRFDMRVDYNGLERPEPEPEPEPGPSPSLAEERDEMTVREAEDDEHAAELREFVRDHLRQRIDKIRADLITEQSTQPKTQHKQNKNRN